MANRITTLVEFVTDSAQRSIQKFTSDIRNAEGATGKFRAGWSGLGDLARQNAMAIAGAAATGVAAAYKLAQGAADTQAKFSALNQVVGETMAQRLDEWASNAADKIGLSRNAVFDAATTFGMFGKEAGLAGAELEGFIQDQIQLAADFAAFKNTSPEQVIQDIRAAYAGSSETLQKYIGTVNDAAIKQAYFEETGERVTGTLTGQQRVIGINALMAEKGADMMGQFARESGEMAGQQAILEARLRNVADTLGEQVLPAFVEMGEMAIELSENIESLDNMFRDLTGGSRGLADVMRGTVRASFGGVLTMTKELSDGAVTLGRQLGILADESKEVVEVNLGLEDGFDAVAKQVREAVSEIEANAEAAEDLTRAERLVEDAIADATDEFKRQQSAARDLRNEHRRSADQVLDLRDAQDRLADEVENATNVLNDQNSTSRDVGGALREVTRAADDAAVKQVELRGYTMDSAAGQREWASSMIETANTMNGPMRAAILEHVARVLGVPEERITEFIASPDPNGLTETERALEHLARTRHVDVIVNAPRNAGGGPGGVFRSSVPGNATPGSLYAGMPGAPAAGGINITVNAGMGADGNQIGRLIVDALREYKRGGGNVVI